MYALAVVRVPRSARFQNRGDFSPPPSTSPTCSLEGTGIVGEIVSPGARYLTLETVNDRVLGRAEQSKAKQSSAEQSRARAEPGQGRPGQSMASMAWLGTAGHGHGRADRLRHPLLVIIIHTWRSTLWQSRKVSALPCAVVRPCSVTSHEFGVLLCEGPG